MRAGLHDVERGAIERLRQAEDEGDESGEPGMALGVNFHTASFTYTQRRRIRTRRRWPCRASALSGATPRRRGGRARKRARAQHARRACWRSRPQQIDQLADVFTDRDPASTAAFLALLEMQTRQNIAEALAASGQLIVVTPQELGLAGAAVQRQMLARGRQCGRRRARRPRRARTVTGRRC